MAKSDYFPGDQDDQDTWMETYFNNLDAALTAVGIAVLEGAATKTSVGNARTSFTTWKNTKQQAQSDSDTFRTRRDAASNLFRPLNQRIKNMPNYTTAIGETIGIEGAEDSTDPATLKPKVKAAFVGGLVEIKFNMPPQAASMEITSKRAAETSYTYLANDTNSPNPDGRASLDTTKPEDRFYILQFKNAAGQLIGQPSDVVKVTVPGG